MGFTFTIVEIMGIISGSRVTQAIEEYLELDSDHVIVEIIDLTDVCVQRPQEGQVKMKVM